MRGCLSRTYEALFSAPLLNQDATVDGNEGTLNLHNSYTMSNSASYSGAGDLALFTGNGNVATLFTATAVTQANGDGVESNFMTTVGGYGDTRNATFANPFYVAPLIIHEIGHARYLVDVYAFGVLAYRMLAGRLPFTAAPDLTLLMKHVTDEAPKLLETTSVPKRLSELVDQLMAKDPNDRPPTMDAVVWQLRAITETLAHEGNDVILRVTTP